jgi:hypothetical protein
MKRYLFRGIACLACLSQTSVVWAQNSIDALAQELKDVEQQHADATAQNLSNFFAQVDQAMTSPDAAVALYKQAGGAMPPLTPVITMHQNETATERETRLAKDQANASVLGSVLQLHCGLLHYAALFITNPDKKGLPDDFNAWLQKAAQAYPSAGTIPDPDAANGGGARHRNPGAPFNVNELKTQTMQNSIIAKFLGFKSWDGKDQAGWAVQGIPKLFKANVLDPLRATPSQATLDAWDAYIAMENADEPDNEKWTSTIYPALQFERSVDDFAVSPGTDKLEALVQIVHANPTHPQADEWLKRAKSLLADFSAKHGGRPAPSVAQNTPPPPPAATTNGNVTVTTMRDGDAQIVTTHTNAAPMRPTP